MFGASLVTGRAVSRSRGLACVAAICVVGVLLAAFGRLSSAEEWPAYRADAARSGQSANALNFPLAPVWRYDPAQAPRPAWPESPRIEFDYGHHPVIADGLVLLGSTVDDTVRALDAATGEIKWTFTTDGPVRFAPHVANGLVYVASDDGFLYCLHLSTGKEKWRFRGGLNDEKILGNGRMISRWSLRTGVLVDEGVAYITAGLWPSESIFIWALKADTGEVIWCNDTSGSRFLAQPHNGAWALTGITPQGYLAASDEVLIIPTGRGLPVQFDRETGRRLTLNNPRMVNRQTGKFFHFHGSVATGRGGAWTTVVNEKGMFLSGSAARLFGFSLHGRPVPSLKAIRRSPYPLYWIYLDRVVVTEKVLFGASTTKGLAGVPGRPRLPDRGRELILAGNVLVAGGKGFLQAYQTDGKKMLDAKIDGEVRGLAVADGRIVASTLEGPVHCFAPAADPGPRRVTDVGRAVTPGTSRAGEDLARMMVARKTTKGYALVVNPEDARMAEALAKRTQLHVIALLRDEDKVNSERRRLLADTPLYGSRVALHHVKDFTRLPFSSYFANLVVVAGENRTLSGKELYRVLRPCGGVMRFVGTAKADASRLVKAAGVPAAEIGTWQGTSLVTRGKLPGAFDWDSSTQVDKRVKWPLEVLWFGEPGPARMADRHWRPHTPVPANGRYFVIGQHHLIAVDAYNGTVLWDRQIHDALTRNNPAIRAIRVYPAVDPEVIKSLYADDENVYVNLGGMFVQYDAQTGEEKAFFGDFPPPETISLDNPHTFHLKVDEEHAGTIKVSIDDQGLKLLLRSVDPDVTGHDAWELFFDFRPADQRFGAYGKGTFHVTMPIGTVIDRRGRRKRFVVRRGAGSAHPEFVAERKVTDTGVEIALVLSWDEMQKLCGERPVGFGFAATLVSNNLVKGKHPLRFTHLAGSKRARAFNDGWPNLVFGPVPKGEGVSVALKKLARPLAEMPETARTWSQRPPDIPYSPAPARFGKREHPITDRPGPKRFVKGYGCRRTGMATETMLFVRSSTLASYDYADDSGLRNFGGIRPGCGGGMLPALGVFIASESSSGCACSYNLQTTVVLAPARRRSREDWALFSDGFPTEDLKHISLNMGAPGDRRDEERTLWLGFPRPRVNPDDPHSGGRLAYAMLIPVSAEAMSGFGPYRWNADRVSVSGTDRPWIYASCYRGLKKMRFDLRHHSAWVSRSTARPPVVDGDLNDACWRESHPQLFTEKVTPVYLRHDKENLYVGFRKPAAADADGNRIAWKKTVKDADGDVWKDDAFELYLTDGEYYHPKITPRRKKACVHLGVSASGARYDALFEHSKTKQRAPEDRAWNAEWSVKIRVDADAFAGEFAIPWKTLADAGVKLDAPLHIVAGKHLGNFWGDFWAWRGFRHVSLIENTHEAERYTVRLHFAEPDDVREGQRVFDVALQGKVVARGVDIFKEAGGRNRALVKAFKNISATRELTLELRPRAGKMTAATVPVLSGIEVFK